MADRVFSYEFRGKFANLTAGLATGGRAVQDFGGKLVALDKQGARMRSGLTDIGNTSGKFGLVAAGGFALAIRGAANFDQAMSNVQAATHETADNMELLRAAALKAGADTAFSATEAAGAIEALSKAGVSTTAILDGGLTGALNLAAAGSLDVSTAAEIAATTLTQFGLAGDQTSHVADLLAASAGKAQGEVTDMAGALKYVGPVAAQMGISLEETTGAIAELASQGIIGEQAGTSLRGMLTALTSPSKAASAEMDALGISMYDASGHFVGLDGIAGQLKGTMSTLSEAERDQALGRIFGNEQITAARILYAGGAEAVQDWTTQVNDSGYAADTAAIKMDNLKGDLEQLGGSLETALIGTGDGSQGFLRGAVQDLTHLVNAYSDLPGPAKTATSATLALAAVLGGSVFVGSKVVGGLSNLRDSMENLGVSEERAAKSTRLLGKAAGATAGLGLLAAGLAETNTALSGLESAAGGAAAGFAITGSPWGAAIGGAVGLVASLTTGSDGASEAVKGLAGAFDIQTGALNDNAAAMAAKQVQDAGGFILADKLGISNKVLTDAVLGSTDAQKQYNAALDAADNGALDVLAGGTNDLITNFATAGEQAKEAASAIHDTSASAGTTGDAFSVLGGAAEGVSATVTDVSDAAKAAAEALKESRKAATTTAEAFFGVGSSVDDAKVSLDGWIDDLEKQGKALDEFRQNAKEAADNGLRRGLIAALQEAGPAGALRMQQLADATDTQIKRANKAWARGQDQVRGYVNEIGGVPKQVTTDVTANTAAALQALRAVDGFIVHDKSFKVTQYTNATVAAANPVSRKKKADGGFVSGPGTGTSDDIPAYLSNGEYVIRAAAVAKYGTAMFDSLNARNFAGGGAVDDDKTPTQRRAAAKKAVTRARARSRANRALGDLDVDLGVDAEGASDALGKFADDVDHIRDLFKDAGMKWTSALKEQTAALTKAARQYDTLTKSLATARTDKASYSSTVGSSLGGELFGNGLAGFQAAADANTADYTAAQTALRTAIANGLDGPLRDALDASGDINAIKQFGALDAAQIAREEQRYAAMTSSQSGFGDVAASAKYDASIAQYIAELKANTATIKRLENKLPEAVGKATREGSRQGSRDGTREGNAGRDADTTSGTRSAGRGGGHRGKGK